MDFKRCINEKVKKFYIDILKFNFSREGILFKWVSWFTGVKNTTKGLGFFIGSILVEAIGFKFSIFTLIVFLTICFVLLFFLQKDLGNLTPSKNLKDLFSKSRNINILSMARVFLFGSRDIWFVVGLPVFLYSNGWSFWQVGSFLALWTIGYGIIQSSIPAFIKRSKDGLSLEILSSKLNSLSKNPSLLSGILP